MTNREVMAKLTELGIDMPAGLADRVNLDAEEFGFAAQLLMKIGLGDYDYDTGEWTPTSSKVYAFDAEVFDIERMYHLFLQGVASIVPGFDPTDICESIEEEEFTGDLTDFDPMKGPIPEGKTTVSFSLNGKTYQRVMNFYGDWFNDDAVNWVNEVLAQEGFSGELHALFDGYQGLILLYGDRDLAAKLREIDGGDDFLMEM